MTYPIDTEKYIAAMRMEFGPNEAAEAAHRVIIPFINDCYQDGLDGRSGYPLVLSEEIELFAQASGRPLEKVKENELLPLLITWANRAYAQGVKESAQ